MAHGFRRIGRRGDEDVANDANESGTEMIEMKTNEGAGPATATEAAAGEQGNDGDPMANLAEVGEHVAAVLTSAQQAAEQMRAEARQEADRVRAEARERAEATIEGAKRAAQKSRADADSYGKSVRETADAYSAEKRDEAESYASRTTAGANQQAQEIRDAAGREANRLVAIGRRKSEALAAEVTHYEERLQRLHSVFGGMTSQLAELLESGAPSRNGGDAATDAAPEAAPEAGNGHAETVPETA